MSTFKKVLSTTLASAMALSLASNAAFVDHNDINPEAIRSVELLAALDVLGGNDKGEFNPELTITRAEAAKMVYVLMNRGETDAGAFSAMDIFSDVESTDWYAGYVNYAYSMNIVGGRGNNIFDPLAPVTGTELAKMLLTAADYDSDKQGYGGANWDDNVVKDASTAGLLEDYNFSIVAPAQRQWAAVMFATAIEDVKMALYLGDWIDYSAMNDQNAKTVGQRFFNLETTTDVALANEHMAIDGGNETSEGKVRFASGQTLSADVDAQYLGLELEVYKNNSSGEVYGVANTNESQAEQAMMIDVEVDGTEITVGEQTFETDGQTIFTNNAGGTDLAASSLAALQALAGDNLTFEVNAIDSNDDGVADFVYTVASQYGQVISMSEKGETLTVHTTANNAYDFEDVNFIGNVKEDSIVKVTHNPQTDKTDIEVLNASVGKVTKIASGVYTIGEQSYELSDERYDTTALAIGATLNVYEDNGFIVSVSTYTENEDKLGENYAMVIATDVSTPSDPFATGDSAYVKVLQANGDIKVYEVAKIDNADVVINAGAWTNAPEIDGIYEFSVDEDGMIELLSRANFTSTTGVTFEGEADNAVAMSFDYDKGIYGSMLTNGDSFFFVKTGTGATAEYEVLKASELTADQAGLATANNTWAQTSDNGIKTMLFGTLIVNSINGGTSDSEYAIMTSNVYSSLNDENDVVLMADGTATDGTEITLTLDDSVFAQGDALEGLIIEYTVKDGVATPVATTAKLIEITGASDTLVQTASGIFNITSDTEIVYVDFDDNGTAADTSDDSLEVTATEYVAISEAGADSAVMIADGDDNITVMFVEVDGQDITTYTQLP